MSDLNADCCVIIPMFNEARVIGEVVDAVRQHFENVVCIDDGSNDATATIAESCGATVVRHPDNLGQGAAIQTGLDYALLDPGHHYIVTFDGDGQHDVNDAVQMVQRVRTGEAQVVLGSRFLEDLEESVPRGRRTVLRMAVWFTRRVSGLPVTDTHNGLRAFSREAAEAIDVSIAGMAHASQILDQIARRDLRFVEHPSHIAYSEYSRAKGQSNVNAINVFLDVMGYVLRGRT